MKTGMMFLAVLTMATGCAISAPDATNAPPSSTETAYRTWVRNGEKLAGARFYKYGGEKYPHEVWLESRVKAGDQPLRLRLPLDSLSYDDIGYLRKNHPDGFPKDYKRKKTRKSESGRRRLTQ